jgi:hypothetical protein
MNQRDSTQNPARESVWFFEPISDQSSARNRTELLQFWCPYEECYRLHCERDCTRQWFCPLYNPVKEK